MSQRRWIMETTTSWSEDFFKKLMVAYLVKKLSALYGNQTVFAV
jgi:hypothetical protein